MKAPSSLFSRCLRAAGAAGAAVGCLSCALTQGDPVHEAQVEALGPEQPGVPQGPYHRPGQPCTVCHSSEGPATSIFSLAGTVFSQPPGSSPGGRIGVENAAVGVLDNAGGEYLAKTNCVGNFYVAPDLYMPAFPILVNVSNPTITFSMSSHITRETSCANCHGDPAGTQEVGHVYLQTSDVPTDCPAGISPNAGGS